MRRQRLSVLYDVAGFTGSGLAHANWKPFGDNITGGNPYFPLLAGWREWTGGRQEGRGEGHQRGVAVHC